MNPPILPPPVAPDDVLDMAGTASPAAVSLEQVVGEAAVQSEWMTNIHPRYRGFGPMLCMNAAARGLDPVAYIEQHLSCRNLHFHVVMAWQGQTPLRSEPRHWIPGHIVGSEHTGPQPADVMLISKMPWKDEHRAGRNLVGASGILLQQELQQYGEPYQHWYVTNILKWVPPTKLNTIPVPWLRECMPVLYYELSLVRPKFIVLMGVDAVKAFYGDNRSLDSQRLTEDTFTWRNTAGEPQWTARVFCTMHAARAAEEARTRQKFTDDCRFFMTAKSNQTNIADVTRYSTLTELEQVDNWVQERVTAQDHIFSIDCEWAGRDPLCDPNENFLRSIQICWSPGHAVYLNMVDHTGHQFLGQHPKLRIGQTLRPLFDHPQARYIGHNIRADYPWLDDLGMNWDSMIAAILRGHDTMLASHVINEHDSHGLETSTLRYTPFGRYEVDVERWRKANAKTIKDTGFRYLPDELLIPYALRDADVPMRTYPHQERILQELHAECVARGQYYTLPDDGTPCTPLTLFYQVVMPATMPIYEMERNGLHVDVDRLEKLIATYHSARETLTGKLREVLNWPEFNFRSTVQMQALLFSNSSYRGKKKHTIPPDAKRFEFEPIKATSKGPEWSRVIRNNQTHLYAPATDKDVLSILYGQHQAPELKMLRDIKFIDQVCKNFLREPEIANDGATVKTYIRGLRGLMYPDQRLRTSFTQLVETGRYGSRRPNLQNIPAKQEKPLQSVLKECGLGDQYVSMRSCFMATPGWVLVEADYKSAELVVMACYSKDPKMMAAVLDKRRDLHLETANGMFSLGLELDPEVCTADQLKVFLKEHSLSRSKAKGINFGIPYGLGLSGLFLKLQSEGVPCTRDEAAMMLDKHGELYPVLHSFLNSAAGCVTTPPYYFQGILGRRRHFLPSEDESIIAGQQREAKNFPIQNAVGESLSMALFRLWAYKRRNPSAGFRMILTVHDSIMFEVRPAYLRQFMVVVRECMRIKLPWLDVALDVDTKISLRWSESADPDALRLAGVSEDDLNEFVLEKRVA